LLEHLHQRGANVLSDFKFLGTRLGFRNVAGLRAFVKRRLDGRENVNDSVEDNVGGVINGAVGDGGR